MRRGTEGPPMLLKHYIVVGYVISQADRLSRIDIIVKTEWALDQSIANSIFQKLFQSGSVCDTFQSQTSTLCVTSSGQSSLCDRRIFHELEPSSCLCISSNNNYSFCPEQDTPISVQNSSYSPSLAATNMVLRGSTITCISSSSSLFSKTINTSKMKVSTSKPPSTQPSLPSNQLEIEIFAKRCRFCLQIKTNINSERL